MQSVVTWLLSGDVALQYQCQRDLLTTRSDSLESLQLAIAQQGWGARYLSLQRPDYHWGKGFYAPKWTCTHYTLLDLRNLGLPADNQAVRRSVELVLNAPFATDGGINYAKTVKTSDVCINGMILNFSSYFDSNHDSIYRVLDHLLAARLVDGGWNCEHRRGARHSSLHTTLSVLEGLHEYRKAGHSYRKQEAMSAEQEGVEFMLKHQLFQSDRTGRVIDGRFLRLAYPSRWRYDILRALDYLQAAGFRYDLRMDEALEVLLRKRRQDGRWLLGAHHAGQTHFPLEQAGQPSRWNTLRALRVFKQLT